MSDQFDSSAPRPLPDTMAPKTSPDGERPVTLLPPSMSESSAPPDPFTEAMKRLDEAIVANAVNVKQALDEAIARHAQTVKDAVNGVRTLMVAHYSEVNRWRDSHAKAIRANAAEIKSLREHLELPEIKPPPDDL